MALIGTIVTYSREPDQRREEGVVTSYNGNYVFVRFSGSTSAGCSPDSLRDQLGNPVRIPANWMATLEDERAAIAAGLGS